MKRIIYLLFFIFISTRPVFSECIDIDVEETDTTDEGKTGPGARSINDLLQVSLEGSNLIVETIYPDDVAVSIYYRDKIIFSNVDAFISNYHKFYVAQVLSPGESYTICIRVGERNYTGFFIAPM